MDRAPPRSGARGRTTCSASGVEPEPVRHRGRLGAAAYSELGEDARYVHAGGLLRHVERVPDLAICPALGHEREHLALARSEAERLLLRDGDRLFIARLWGGAVDALELEAPACAQAFHLALEPARAEPAGCSEGRAGGDAGAGTVAGHKVSLGLAPAGERRLIRPFERVPGFGRLSPERGLGLALHTRPVRLGGGEPRALDRALALGCGPHAREHDLA